MTLETLDWSGLWPAIRYSAALAAVVTVLLLTAALPIAWWLGTTRSMILRPAIEAVIVLPLVLPAGALGVLVLGAIGPDTPAGDVWAAVTGAALHSGFPGLVLAACVYSLPFAVLPMTAAFRATSTGLLDAARTLGARRVDAFFSVALPPARHGVVSAAALTFAHTLGAHGVLTAVAGEAGTPPVLGAEIAGALGRGDGTTAWAIAVGLLAVSLVALFLLYGLGAQRRRANV